MVNPITYSFKNINNKYYTVLIEEIDRWTNDGLSDIRIEFSVKINSNDSEKIIINNIISYIDKCSSDELVDMEKIVKNSIIKAVNGIIDLDSPGIHNLDSYSLDLRTKTKRNVA